MPQPDTAVTQRECAETSAAGTKTPAAAPAQTYASAETDAQAHRGDTRLRAQIDEILRQYGTVGAQVAVIENGALRLSFSFGFADRGAAAPVEQDTKFRCASLSKLITAMTVMSLRETGEIDLGADVGQFLGCTVRNPRYPDVPITCEMLMTHTSSVVDSAAFLDSRNASSSAEMSDLLSKRSTYSAAEPGTQYNYSNFGAAILAASAECAAGKDFDTLAKERLFVPLGMDASYLASKLRDPSLTANLYGADGGLQWSAQRQIQEKQSARPGQTHHLYQGNLTVSASDYARLLCVLLNDGTAGGVTVLQPQSVRQILSVRFSSGGLLQGYCVKRLEHVVEGRSMWCHTGLNYGVYTSFAMDPSDRSGVVVFTSGADARQDGSELFDVCTQIIRLCYAAEQA